MSAACAPATATSPAAVPSRRVFTVFILAPHLSWPDNRTFLAGHNGKPLSTQAQSVVSSRLLQECFTNRGQIGVPCHAPPAGRAQSPKFRELGPSARRFGRDQGATGKARVARRIAALT